MTRIADFIALSLLAAVALADPAWDLSEAVAHGATVVTPDKLAINQGWARADWPTTAAGTVTIYYSGSDLKTAKSEYYMTSGTMLSHIRAPGIDIFIDARPCTPTLAARMTGNGPSVTPTPVPTVTPTPSPTPTPVPVGTLLDALHPDRWDGGPYGYAPIVYADGVGGKWGASGTWITPTTATMGTARIRADYPGDWGNVNGVPITATGTVDFPVTSGTVVILFSRGAGMHEAGLEVR